MVVFVSTIRRCRIAKTTHLSPLYRVLHPPQYVSDSHSSHSQRVQRHDSLHRLRRLRRVRTDRFTVRQRAQRERLLRALHVDLELLLDREHVLHDALLVICVRVEKTETDDASQVEELRGPDERVDPIAAPRVHISPLAHFVK